MALRFPAKKRPTPQRPAAPPALPLPEGDGGQAPRPDAAFPEAFHLEMELHPEELSLLKRLSEQLVRMLGGVVPRAVSRTRKRSPQTRTRKPRAAGRKATFVRRRVARRR